MKRFMLVHYGFEKPTPEIMAKWKAWFEAVGSYTVENIGLRAGREITRDGARDLPMGPDSITGCTVITAESMDAAEALARQNPFISSIRVYEIAAH
ncbi:hypothetical protein [Terricaulis sp.]|uniref:hypothetical protein n=1 Tax=Terricaulis sp. TaxID=2768686 RepID=UPI0037848F58